MKLSKMSCLFALTVLAATGNSMVTNAADGTTKGKINFTEGTVDPGGSLTLIKPGTPDSVITMDGSSGNQTTGSLRFSFIPNLDFGDANISVLDQIYYAKPVEYTEKGDATKKFLPPFVQVLNESGLPKNFKVKVYATPFTSVATNHVLTNTEIKFKDLKSRNSLFDKTNPNTDATAYITLPNLASTNGEFIVPKEAANAKELFGAADKDKTIGSASSVVFQKDYKLGSELKADSKIESVLLSVPASDTPKKEAYSSTINWNLEDTP